MLRETFSGAGWFDIDRPSFFNVGIENLDWDIIGIACQLLLLHMLVILFRGLPAIISDRDICLAPGDTY